MDWADSLPSSPNRVVDDSRAELVQFRADNTMLVREMTRLEMNLDNAQMQIKCLKKWLKYLLFITLFCLVFAFIKA